MMTNFRNSKEDLLDGHKRPGPIEVLKLSYILRLIGSLKLFD